MEASAGKTDMQTGVVTPVVLALALTAGSTVGASDEPAAGVFTPAGR